MYIGASYITTRLHSKSCSAYAFFLSSDKQDSQHLRSADNNTPRLRHRRRYCGILGLAVIGMLGWTAAAVHAAGFDLAGLSIEELMDLEVSLTSRSAERFFETPAAIFVLTGEDLRRSGADNIPDALRLVPGMQIGHIDANKWAVSARGFADRFTNKMLVIIDGRTVYSPLFSGVLLEVRDVLLEDVERVEVVRGPGATLWGSNAVNGIINIVTKTADNTAGSVVQAGTGTPKARHAAARYGDHLGERGAYRVYAKYFDRPAFDTATRTTAVDDWHVLRAGFRVDWVQTTNDEFTVQEDLFRGEAGQTFRFPILEVPFVDNIDDDTRLRGGNLLALWQRKLAPDSDMRLQFYYDRNERADVAFVTDTDAVDIDFQHRLRLAQRQDLVWGAGYRFDRDDTRGSFKSAFDQSRRSTNWLWLPIASGCRSASRWNTMGIRGSSTSQAPACCGCPITCTLCGRPCRGPCARRRATTRTCASRSVPSRLTLPHQARHRC